MWEAIRGHSKNVQTPQGNCVGWDGETAALPAAPLPFRL